MLMWYVARLASGDRLAKPDIEDGTQSRKYRGVTEGELRSQCTGNPIERDRFCIIISLYLQSQLRLLNHTVDSLVVFA